MKDENPKWFNQGDIHKSFRAAGSVVVPLCKIVLISQFSKCGIWSPLDQTRRTLKPMSEKRMCLEQ